MVVISVYIYGVKIIKKFRWESGFLKGGSMELTEVRGTLCSFNLKVLKCLLSVIFYFYSEDTVWVWISFLWNK